MPKFEVVYSVGPMSEALFTETFIARNRTDAADKAAIGFRTARLVHKAQCYRVIDGSGMVVTRGPKAEPR